MTVKEAADIIGKGPEWVRAGIISGYFPVGIATRDGKQVTIDHTHKYAWCLKGERKDAYGNRT